MSAATVIATIKSAKIAQQLIDELSPTARTPRRW